MALAVGVSASRMKSSTYFLKNLGVRSIDLKAFRSMSSSTRLVARLEIAEPILKPIFWVYI